MIIATYHAPLGTLTLAADEQGLCGLWFAGQQHFGSTLDASARAAALSALATAPDVASLVAAASPDGRGGGRRDNDAAPGHPSAPAPLPAFPAEWVGAHDAVSGAPALSVHFPQNTAALSVLERTWAWLNAYFAGRCPTWLPPLHMEGTAFQHEVWTALLGIPYGHTTTYGALAAALTARHTITGEGARKVSARAVGAAVARNPISIIVPCHRVLGAGGALTGYAAGVACKRRLLELEGVHVAA